jgi:succinyl-diaminopimelate desuccinylase
MPGSPSFQDAIRFAQDLIRTPSLPGNEGAVGERVMVEMEALGFDEVSRDSLGNVIGILKGTAGAPPVLLNCHMDIVAAGDPADWEYPPFEGVIADGFLHGRGAMDIKGPLAIQTHAAAELRGTNRGDVIVAHTVFEERGGWGMEYLLETSGLRPGAVIIGESTHGDVTIGHRGRAEVEVVIHGLAGHASVPERARNALHLLPAVIQALEDLGRHQQDDPILGRASLVPTMVDVLPQSRNVIPDQVVVTGDWRILPGDDDDSLLRRVREALDRHLPGVLPDGFSVEVRMAREVQTSFMGPTEQRALLTPGFLMDEQHPVVRAAARAVGRKSDPGIPALVRPWAFATDGGWSSGVFGIPTIGFAPGEERHAHTNTERLELEEARWAYDRYPELIRAIQAALEEG